MIAVAVAFLSDEVTKGFFADTFVSTNGVKNLTGRDTGTGTRSHTGTRFHLYALLCLF